MIKALSVLMVLFISFQLNAQWVSQTSGVSGNLWSVSAVDNNVCWIGGEGGVVLRTTNGGTNWTNVGGGLVIGTSNTIDNVYASDANTCLAAATSSSGNAYVYRTTNGGNNWAQVFAQNHCFIDAVYMRSAANGFMVGDPVNSRWSLWKTSNEGLSWDSTGLYLKASGNEGGWNNSLYINGSNIWFGTNNSKIYHSSDDGTTWNAQTIPMLNIFDISFSGNIGIAGCSTAAGDGAILISTDNGTSWTPGPFRGSGSAACAAKGNNFLYTTLTGSIYLSTNGGVSFSKADSVSGNVYYDISIASRGNSVWTCGTGGTIRKGNINLTVINDMKPVVQNFLLEQNYPNPFNPSTTIKYSIDKPGLVKINVYNELGQRIKELVNEVKESGSYSIFFNGSTIASGIYFYRIETNQFSQVRKMIVVK